jgi:hypothetical protein
MKTDFDPEAPVANAVAEEVKKFEAKTRKRPSLRNDRRESH